MGITKPNVAKNPSLVQSSSQISPRGRRQLALLLTIVFLSRLFFAFVIWKVNGPTGFFSPDTGSYVVPAQSLLHGSFTSQGVPEIYRTPGYPLLLLPAVALRYLASVGLFENLLLAVASAWLIWRILTDICPDTKAPTWAVLLYCFEPMGFLYSEKVLSETLFSTQVLLSIWFLIRFLRNPTYTKLLLSALALGCATYTRPATLFIGFWLVPLLLLFPRTLEFSRRASRTILFLSVFLLTLTPWVVRNVAVAGYMGISAASDYILYFYPAAAVKAKSEHKSFSQVQGEFGYGGEWGYVDNKRYFQKHAEQRTWSQSQIFQFEHTQAQRIISRHLLSFFIIQLEGCAIMLFDPGVTDLLKVVRLYPESGGLLTRVVDQGAVRAIFWLVRQYPVTVAALLLLGTQLISYYSLALVGLREVPFDMGVLFAWIVLYFVLVSGGPAGLARYRVPIMPLVCISAGVAIANWTVTKFHRKSPAYPDCLVES